MPDDATRDIAERVYEAAKHGCTNREIAQIVGLKTRELKRYRSVIERARAELCEEIREQQLEIARKGGRSRLLMLIWLGKQYLGQTEPRAGAYAPSSDEFRVAGLTRDQVIERLKRALEDAQEQCQPQQKNERPTSSNE